MKFDSLFPNSKDNFQPQNYKLMAYYAPPEYSDGPCHICGNMTQWVELGFECYLCSSECYDKILKNYEKALNNAPTK